MSELIKVIGENLGVVLMAIAAVVTSIGGYLVIKGKNTVTYADGWERYSKKLEERITALEKKDEERETLMTKREEMHFMAMQEKNVRIDELEARIDYLEAELKKTKLSDAKIEDAKIVLHEKVEEKLEDLKK